MLSDAPTGWPTVPLPERVDRPLRLGPFPSARDALKFLCYAGVGVALVPLVDLPFGLAVAAAGFLVAVHHPEGRPWDERALDVLRWKWRATSGGRMRTSKPRPPLIHSGLVRLGEGDWVAVVRTGGVPLAFLPPSELARRFESYRDLLRASDGRLLFLATLSSIRAAPFLPPEPGGDGPDRAARAGYSELVELLCRRRHGRRIYLVVGGRESGMEGVARLEGQVALLLEHLTALGLAPVRLKDRALLEAARRLDWPVEGVGE